MPGIQPFVPTRVYVPSFKTISLGISARARVLTVILILRPLITTFGRCRFRVMRESIVRRIGYTSVYIGFKCAVYARNMLKFRKRFLV